MVFLDTNAVIDLIERPGIFGPTVTARITALLSIGERLAVSDLVRMECQVGSLKANRTALLARYVAFFQSPDVSVLPVASDVCDRAARIRAQHGFKPLDALHLAAALEHGCTRFLTNDDSLNKFPDLIVETLS
jgi:uncharacterized protein